MKNGKLTKDEERLKLINPFHRVKDGPFPFNIGVLETVKKYK